MKSWFETLIILKIKKIVRFKIFFSFLLLKEGIIEVFRLFGVTFNWAILLSFAPNCDSLVHFMTKEAFLSFRLINFNNRLTELYLNSSIIKSWLFFFEWGKMSLLLTNRIGFFRLNASSYSLVLFNLLTFKSLVMDLRLRPLYLIVLIRWKEIQNGLEILFFLLRLNSENLFIVFFGLLYLICVIFQMKISFVDGFSNSLHLNMVYIILGRQST